MIADLVMRLVTAGAGPIEAAAIVAEAFARGMSERDASRDVTLPVTVSARSPGAIRAARYREKRKQNQAKTPTAAVAMAGAEGVTNGRDASRDGVTRVPLSILSSLSESQGIQEEKKQEVLQPLSTEPREKAKRKRGERPGCTRMTEDWYPDAKGMQKAADRGLRLIEIEIEVTKFRNYWINRTDRDSWKPRWDLAWENWLLNVKGSPNAQRSIIAAQDRLNDKLAEFAEPDMLPGVRGQAGAPHVRLLSSR